MESQTVDQPTKAMANMVMTILEAHVAPENWATLEQASQQGGSRLPAQMAQVFLVQSAQDATLWRLISLWRGRAALEDYQRSVETPGGVLLFRAADAEPALSIFEVAVQHSGPAAPEQS